MTSDLDSDPSSDSVVSAWRRAQLFCKQTIMLSIQRSGVGIDDYSDVPVVHPMAEAKLLCTAASCLRRDFITPYLFQDVCERSAARLKATGIKFGNGLAWGLNFVWNERNASHDEPYLITTALVASALVEARSAGWAGGDALESSAQAALLNWPRSSSGIPLYSPAIAQEVVNTAAAWAVALHDLGSLTPSLFEPVAALLNATYIDGIGWKYAVDNGTIDLVHNAYILRCALKLLPFEQTENRALGVLTTFSHDGSFIEKIQLRPIYDIFETMPRQRLQIREGLAAIYSPNPTRPWSIGEMLVVLSELTLETSHTPFWQRHLRRACLAAIDRYATTSGAIASILFKGENPKMRFLTHVSHGFARSLETLRHRSLAQQATSLPNTPPNSE